MNNLTHIFISYSTQNKEFAEQIRQSFLENGLPIWMAPYSIAPGSSYAEEINIAIENCNCFVLLLSNASQNSIFVRKEVERAVSKKKRIIPLLLETVKLNNDLEFFISDCQFTDLRNFSIDNPNFLSLLTTLKNVCLEQNNNVTTTVFTENSIEKSLERQLLKRLNVILEEIELDISLQDFSSAKNILDKLTSNEESYPRAIWNKNLRFLWCNYLIKLKKTYNDIFDIFKNSNYNQVDLLMQDIDYKKIELVLSSQSIENEGNLPYEKLSYYFAKFKKERDTKINPLYEKCKKDILKAQIKEDYQQIIDDLSTIISWKDSAELIKKCKSKIKQIADREITTKNYKEICEQAKIAYSMAKDEDDFIKIKKILKRVNGAFDSLNTIALCDKEIKKFENARELVKAKEQIIENKKKKLSNLFTILFFIIVMGATLFGIGSCINCAYKDCNNVYQEAVDNGKMLINIQLKTNTTNVSEGETITVTAVAYPTSAIYVGVNGDYPQDLKWYIVQNGEEKEIAKSKTNITYRVPSSDFSIYAKADVVVSNTLIFIVT